MIKLLHVEDDLDIQEIAKLALELSGEFDVLQCSSGSEALERVLDFGPDVILLDMMMPGMTGKETLTHMRKMPEFEHTPAIFMTARAQASDLAELQKIGAAEIISKPFDPMTLGAQIRQAMA